MSPKKALCQNWKLYVIADKEAAAGRPLKEIVQLAIQGGADVIQLRDKIASDAEFVREAKELLQITRAHHVPLILNDRVQAARDSGADGVHLGQEDGDFITARKALGKHALIGRSTHTPEQAALAEKEGFDYIGVGPVFKTPTKPDYQEVGLALIKYAAKQIRIPFVAIGGIDESNVRQVRQAGAHRVAVVRAVAASPNPSESAKKLKALLA